MTDRSQKRPAFQWYPGDAQRDTALRSLPLVVRGLWREMLDLMHDGAPYGHLTTAAGAPIAPEALARMVGEPARKVTAWLAELEAAGVFSRTGAGVIYSRRMVRDEHVRTVRAAAGAKGGNPALLGSKRADVLVNHPDIHPPNQPAKQSPTPAVAVAVAVARSTTPPSPPPVAAGAANGNANGNGRGHPPEPPPELPPLPPTPDGGDPPPAPAATGTRAPRALTPTGDEAWVLAQYRALHPRRNPGGDDDVRAIRKALSWGYGREALAEAFAGNAEDEWHRDKRKHALTYVLRSRGLIDDFRDKHAAAHRPLKDTDPETYYAMGGV